MIGDAASAGASSVTIFYGLSLRIPDISHAPILAAASIIVVQIPATATLGTARRQRQDRCLAGEIAPARILQRCIRAIRAGLDADRMVGIGHAVYLHRSARKLYLGLDSLLMPPGQDALGHVRVFLNVSKQSTANHFAATTVFPREELLL